MKPAETRDDDAGLVEPAFERAAPTANAPLSARERKLFELRLKLNESRKANRHAVVEEKKRKRRPRRTRRRRRRGGKSAAKKRVRRRWRSGAWIRRRST